MPNKDFAAWRQARHDELTAPDSWLGLVGLFWLEPGLNTVGSGADVAIRLPSGPARAGVLRWEEGRVFWQTDHAPAVELKTDSSGQPDTVDIENLTFFVVDRDGRLAVRLRDREWSIRSTFRGLDYYSYDPAWRVEADWQLLVPPLRMEVPNMSGEIKQVDVTHQAVFTVAGQAVTLLPMSIGDKEVFFVFRDRYQRARNLWCRPFPESARCDHGSKGWPQGRRQNQPRFQFCLQPAVRLYAVRDLSVATAGKLAALCRAGGRESSG